MYKDTHKTAKMLYTSNGFTAILPSTPIFKVGKSATSTKAGLVEGSSANSSSTSSSTMSSFSASSSHHGTSPSNSSSTNFEALAGSLKVVSNNSLCVGESSSNNSSDVSVSV